MKIVAIVQARRGSTRLPNKVIADVRQRPLLGWVLERARAIPGITTAILATTLHPADHELVDVARRMGIASYTGSEENVLDRYYQAALAFGAEAIVRITADCPLLDPVASGRVVERFLVGDADYVSNVHPRSVPDGMDTEICSMAALSTAWTEGRSLYEREHVTPYLWQKPESFRVRGLGEDPLDSKLRLTVDYPEDLELVRALYARFSAHEAASAGLPRLIEILRQEPSLLTVNPRIGWTEDDLAEAGSSRTP